MRPGVLCAVPGRAEASLVAALDAPGTGVHVVRRCADVPEVLAAALAGVGRVAVVGSGLGGVDRAAVARLRDAGVRVAVLADVGDTERCRALGPDVVLPVDAPTADVVRAVRTLAETLAAPLPPGATDVPPATSGRPVPAYVDPWAVSDVGMPDPGADVPDGVATRHGGARGSLVVVWGPHGAPGRTTLAISLAAEFAGFGQEALVADADTWGGCVGQSLGLLDESPGLAAATRAAANGALDTEALGALCPVVEPGLRVLTGLSRPDRWRELAPAALDVVWDVARRLVPWTVVDCGFSLEDDAGAGFEAMLGPRRNGATLSALAAADVVVAVGSADPVGIQRLVQGLADLAEAGLPAPGVRRIVVVNRVRASAAGPRPEQAVTEALARYAGVADPVLVPDDRPAFDSALLTGVTLRAAAPHSPARAAVAALAKDLIGPGASRRRKRRGRRRRWSR